MTNTTGNAATRRAGARETRTLPDGRVVSRKGKVAAPAAGEGPGAQAAETAQDAQARAATFIGVSTSTMASRTGYLVECPLPAYKGLSVLYRTSNQTRRRRERPRYEEPYELRQKRQALAALNEKLDALSARLFPAKPKDESGGEPAAPLEPQERDALTAQLAEVEGERDALVLSIIAASQEYADAFRAEECRWLSLFVIGFEGWPFEDIPEPDPDDPDSYVVLWQELEDLYFWLLDRGYSLALAEATKNY